MLFSKNRRAFFYLTQKNLLTDITVDYSYHLDGHEIVEQKLCPTVIISWFDNIVEF